MAAAFDFNKIKPTFMSVTLTDGRKLLVGMPKKKTFERISALREMASEDYQGNLMEDLCELCAEILSNNQKKEPVTVAALEENYEFDHLWALINAYVDFISQVKRDPN